MYSVAPLILPFSFGDEPANSGDSNAIQCMVTKGDLPLTFKWSLNGHLVRSGDNGIIISKISPRLSTLSIESMNSYHRGNFMCIAENVAGESNFTTELRVNGECGKFFIVYTFITIQSLSLFTKDENFLRSFTTNNEFCFR